VRWRRSPRRCKWPAGELARLQGRDGELWVRWLEDDTSEASRACCAGYGVSRERVYEDADGRFYIFCCNAVPKYLYLPTVSPPVFSSTIVNALIVPSSLYNC